MNEKDTRKKQNKFVEWIKVHKEPIKIAIGVIVLGGIAYLASKSSSDEDYIDCSFSDGDYDIDSDSDEDTEVYGLGKGKYPICKTCGAEMTGFDGWAWYTCPECENSVRIIEDKVTWHDEIFKNGTKPLNSDFALADLCRGGDLTED